MHIPPACVSLSVSVENATYLRDKVADEIAALKNHIAKAVECGVEEYGKSGQTGLEYAQYLVPRLRKAEGLFAHINAVLGN